ncbi:helitron-like helicase [Hamiltosporidium tvaerminnensis]|uniref:Helitron-like helicase n=1 Tax=Hamiltosporidium tvaerminnensis TaxID=1176355 RepID=A0A4Q9M0D8_9MICR|nr:helitron-like helicase [Hamiltosporidium tvaerminnensis]
MKQKYQDAMAIVRKYGKPDLFITMTCNPNYAEISENLDANEKRENRPDLVDRVFREKHKALMADIIKNKIFGKVKAYCYVIEFQNRGLPHAHILITLEAILSHAMQH